MGSNDIGIIVGIISFFIGVGLILPWIYADFGYSYDGVTVTKIEEDLGSVESPTATQCTDWIACIIQGTVSSTNMIWSSVIGIFNLLLWGFGILPFWLNMIFWILRITLIVVIGRQFLGSGG